MGKTVNIMISIRVLLYAGFNAMRILVLALELLVEVRIVVGSCLTILCGSAFAWTRSQLYARVFWL